MPPSEAIYSMNDPELDVSDVVEIPLLLSGRQMSALERAAYHRGITAAEMVRQLLREFIQNSTLSC